MEDFWVDLILRLGFPIVVILAMIKGYLVPGFIYERVAQEATRLTQLAEEKLYPLSIESQQFLREALEILKAERQRLEADEREREIERIAHQRAHDAQAPREPS